MLKIKRAYDAPEKDDGFRILVDRIWPRGMTKEKEHLDLWAKDIAPTTDLRKAFGHQPERFIWFREHYIHELDQNTTLPDFLETVRRQLKSGNVTLLYGAKDPEHNQAVVLRDYLEKK